MKRKPAMQQRRRKNTAHRQILKLRAQAERALKALETSEQTPSPSSEEKESRNG